MLHGTHFLNLRRVYANKADCYAIGEIDGKTNMVLIKNTFNGYFWVVLDTKHKFVARSVQVTVCPSYQTLCRNNNAATAITTLAAALTPPTVNAAVTPSLRTTVATRLLLAAISHVP